MKRLIVFLAIMAGLIMACNPSKAQDVTHTFVMGSNDTYYNYTGSAADTLGAVDQDTIDLVFVYRGDRYIEKVAVKTRFDVVDGADTTCNISVFGKEFSDDGTYVQVIASTLSGDINVNNTTKVIVSDPYTVEAQAQYTISGADSVTLAHNFTPFDKSYRYYRVRYIHIGTNSAAGSGILIDDVEFKLYTK